MLEFNNYNITFELDRNNIVELDFLTGDVKILKNGKGFEFKNLKSTLESSNIESKINSLIMKAKSIQEISGTLLISYACNFDCNYCFQSNIHQKTSLMTTEQIDHAFSIMENNKYPQYKAVSIFGGEPLLNRNYMVVKYILERTPKDWRISIPSNGATLIQYADLLNQFANQLSLQITIDGPAEIHNKRRVFLGGGPSFDKIIEGIDYLLNKTNINISIRINTDRSTLNYLEKLREFFSNRGYFSHKNISFYIAPTDYESVQFDGLDDNCPYIIRGDFEFYNLLMKILEENKILYDKKWSLNFLTWKIIGDIFLKNSLPFPSDTYCKAQKGALLFDCFGDLYSCWQEAGNKDYKVGTYHPKYELNKYYDQWVNRTTLNIPECKNCVLKYVCGGECGFSARKKNNTLFSPGCINPEIEINKIKISLPYIWEKYINDFEKSM